MIAFQNFGSANKEIDCVSETFEINGQIKEKKECKSIQRVDNFGDMINESGLAQSNLHQKIDKTLSLNKVSEVRNQEQFVDTDFRSITSVTTENDLLKFSKEKSTNTENFEADKKIIDQEFKELK